MKESKRNGTGTENLYKPQWHMFDRLMFLKKACVQAESESNIPSILLKTTDTSNSELSQFCNKENNIPCTQNMPLFNMYFDDTLQVIIIS